MLIKLLGMYLMVNQIVYVMPIEYDSTHEGLECRIDFTKGHLTILRSCDEIVATINKQLKETK